MNKLELFWTIIGILMVLGVFSIPVIIIIYIYTFHQSTCDCKINKYISHFIQYWTLFISIYFIIYTILVTIKKELKKLVIFNLYLVLVLVILSILSSILLFIFVGKIDNQNCICKDKINKIHSFLYTFRYFILVFQALILLVTIKSL